MASDRPVLRRCVLATANRGKLREMQALLEGTGWEISAQAALGIESPAETGETFVENAILKARHAACLAGRPALADDSGIEVDALDGRPGALSARFAGPGASDEANLQKLLACLAAVPDEGRTARYRCVVVLMRHGRDATPLICSGTWEGRIAPAPRGAHGFGYDPVFLVPALGLTAAELDPELKHRLSHRGQAMRALRRALDTIPRGDGGGD